MECVYTNDKTKKNTHTCVYTTDKTKKKHVHDRLLVGFFFVLLYVYDDF